MVDRSVDFTAENPQEAQEVTRGRLAVGLLWILAFTVGGMLLFVGLGVIDGEDLIQSVFPSLVTLTGTALGFYFGSRDATENTARGEGTLSGTPPAGGAGGITTTPTEGGPSQIPENIQIVPAIREQQTPTQTPSSGSIDAQPRVVTWQQDASGMPEQASSTEIAPDRRSARRTETDHETVQGVDNPDATADQPEGGGS